MLRSLKLINPIFLSLITFLSSPLIKVSLSEQIGWQSSWNSGEDYASSIYHNATSNVCILIGTSYNNSNGISRCIVSEIDMKKDKPTMQYVKDFTGDDILTSCTSLSVHGAGSLIVTGFMEQSHKISSKDESFTVTDSSVGNSDAANAINGFMLNIDGNTGNGINGRIMTENKVTYPLLSVADNINGGIIIASLITSDTSLNRNYEYEEELPTGKISHPNPNVLKYGASGSPGMSIALEYFNYVRSTGTFRNGWTRVLSTTDEKDVRIHDMVLYRNKAILVGATAGHGGPFGDKDYTGSSDLDGFITSVLADDGTPLTPSKRIATEGNREDIVNAICIDYLNHVIYVAGSTTGFMDPALKRSARFNRFSAFLMKLDADSLDTIWVKQVFTQPSQVYAPQDVLGMGCTVDPKDGDNGVYLTGIVHDHGNIEKEGLGNGLDDIFVAKFNSNGNELWRKQIGTDKNDVVAKGHKSITFDDEGNIMVLGTTRGNMYRQKNMNMKDYTSDMFIITLDKDDGAYPPLMKPMQTTTGVMVASTSTVASISAGTVSSSTESSNVNNSKPIKIFGLTMLGAFLMFALFLGAYSIGSHRTKQSYLRHQEDDHAEVQRYLEQLEQQEQAQVSQNTKSATVTSTLKSMFTSKRSSPGVDALHLENNGSVNIAPKFENFPQEIRFDDEPITNQSSQFTVSELGVTDDFMGGNSIASDNHSTTTDDVESSTKHESDSNNSNSAYDELLQGLHSISGVNDILDTELEKVDINDVIKNDDNAKKENGVHTNHDDTASSNPFEDVDAEII